MTVPVDTYDITYTSPYSPISSKNSFKAAKSLWKWFDNSIFWSTTVKKSLHVKWSGFFVSIFLTEGETYRTL